LVSWTSSSIFLAAKACHGSYLKALAAARPIVAYDCDGAREVCLDQQTGFLIRAGDLSSLTQAILRLAGDAELRRQFGERGQSFVRDNFGVEQMVENIYLLYRKLADQHGLQIT
jgi:glycosyltransferase involved in cell wall biosynthesis